MIFQLGANLADINDKIVFYKHNVCDEQFMHDLLLKGDSDYIYYLAAVYGNAADFPKTENSHVDPLTPYAIYKYASERYTIDFGRLYDMPTVAVRFFNVYGPRQNSDSEYSGVLSIVTKCLKEDKPFTLYGDGTQTRDFVYVEDVVDALIKISTETDEPTVYNIANGDETPLIDVIHTYEDIAGRKLNIIQKEARQGDISKSRADVSKLKKLDLRRSGHFTMD